MKRYFTAVETYAASPTEEGKQQVDLALAKAYSKIDKAVKRGVLHRNTGARKKSRLVRFWQRVGQSVSPNISAENISVDAAS